MKLLSTAALVQASSENIYAPSTQHKKKKMSQFEDDKTKRNRIIGIVIGVVAIAIIIGIIWFVIYRKRKAHRFLPPQLGAYPTTWQAITGQYGT